MKKADIKEVQAKDIQEYKQPKLSHITSKMVIPIHRLYMRDSYFCTCFQNELCLDSPIVFPACLTPLLPGSRIPISTSERMIAT